MGLLFWDWTALFMLRNKEREANAMLKSNELLFENKEEKTMIKTMSPFKYIEGEKVIFEEEKPFARNLWLNEMEWDIIKLVNSCLWISSKQICEMLSQYDALTLKKNIKFLADNNYLRKAYFSTELGRSTARAYCVGWRAKRELKRENIMLNRSNELDSHTPEEIKEILSSNQTKLAYGLEKLQCTVRKPIYTQSWFVKSCFRVAGYLVTDNNEQVLLNSVRTHKEEELTEKLARIYKTLKRNNSLDKKLGTVLLFICDSNEHMDWVKSCVERHSKLEKLDMRIEFTCDNLTNIEKREAA